jgi:hypothetical protein
MIDDWDDFSSDKAGNSPAPDPEEMDEFDRNQDGDNVSSGSSEHDDYDIVEDMGKYPDSIGVFEPEDLDAAFARREEEQAHREYLEALEEDNLRQEGWLPIEARTGSIVSGDTIRFTETVWDKDFHKKEILGTRTNTVRITRESYSKRLNHSLYFVVMDSCGTEPLEKDKQSWRSPETIRRNEYYRQRWDDESKREEAVAKSKRLYRDLVDRWFEDYEMEGEEGGDGIRASYSPAASRKPNSCADSDEEDKIDYIEQLSEEEQKWVDSEWHNNVSCKIFPSHRWETWLLDTGWRPLFATHDRAVVGDIIRFSNPHFTGRYPHGKYCGRSIVIAEIIKVGRKYYHLKLLACKGPEPRCGSGRIFKRKFDTVHYKASYRLPWRSEWQRMSGFSKRTHLKFSSPEEFLEYIAEEEQA